MKFTFASALIAASASALDIKAVPHYTAGFIYGMTGANHLHEIENCYHTSSSLLTDAHQALNDIQEGDWTKAMFSLRKILKEYPDTLTTCKNLDEDLATIDDWATIFTQPEALAKTAGKNFLLHRKTIMGDINDEKDHWAAGQYFNAGIDTAMALTEIIPMENQAFTVVYQQDN